MIRRIRLVVLLFASGSILLAGYSVEWRMPLHRASARLGGYAGHQCDANNDGLPDVYVHYGSPLHDSIVFFGGVTHQRFLSISDPYPQSTLFTAVTANTDADPVPELIVCWYFFASVPYSFRFRVYDCASGKCEFESPDFLMGTDYQFPVPADIDGDSMAEICLSYGDTLNSTWEAWGWSAGVGEASSPAALGSHLRVAPSISRTPVLIYGVPLLGSPVSISDACGRVVRVLAAAGIGPILWDGTDDQSRPVAPGCYFVRANGRVIKVITLP